MNPTVNYPGNNSCWARFSSRCVHAFHAYAGGLAGWLVSISWKHFFMLALLLIISMAIIHDLPPFSWTYLEAVSDRDTARQAGEATAPSGAPADKASKHSKKGGENFN